MTSSPLTWRLRCAKPDGSAAATAWRSGKASFAFTRQTLTDRERGSSAAGWVDNPTDAIEGVDGGRGGARRNLPNCCALRLTAGCGTPGTDDSRTASRLCHCRDHGDVKASLPDFVRSIHCAGRRIAPLGSLLGDRGLQGTAPCPRPGRFTAARWRGAEPPASDGAGNGRHRGEGHDWRRRHFSSAVWSSSRPPPSSHGGAGRDESLARGLIDGRIYVYRRDKRAVLGSARA
jgi:hypothetical protein